METTSAASKPPTWCWVVSGLAVLWMLFGLSLAAVIVQFGYTFLGMHAMQVLGAAATIPFQLVIFLIGVALLWFARRSRKSGWTADKS